MNQEKRIPTICENRNPPKKQLARSGRVETARSALRAKMEKLKKGTHPIGLDKDHPIGPKSETFYE